MKLFSMLVAAVAAGTSVASAAESDSRNLLTLAEKWNITDPTFDYDSLSFDLDYKVSDYITDDMIEVKIYDSDCKDGGVEITTSTLGVAKTLQDLSGNDITSAATSISTGLEANRVSQVNITVIPSVISSVSDIYTEEIRGGERFAVIDFCVRFQLKTSGGSSIEVNFLETLVTLNVDLTDGFDIGTINVAPKEQLVKTANQAYEVEAYQCGNNYSRLSTQEQASTRNQGSIIRVCVWPTGDARADGIYMRDIQSFEFLRTFATGEGPGPTGSEKTQVTQIAIINGIEAANGLTEMTCAPGYVICMFETILFADFYHIAGQVTGTGVASMQFGGSYGRRLRGEDRNLQEDDVAGVAEFDMNFETVAAADDAGFASGAVSNTVTMVLAVVSGAAAVLMM